MKAKVLLCILVVALTTGCSTTVRLIDSNARTLEPEHNMLLMPLAADLFVSPIRITHVETRAFEHESFMDASSLSKKTLDKYTTVALNRAANAHNADVIVGALIDITTIDGKLKITISGYPANYRNFRNATIDDTEVIKAIQMQVDSLEIKEEQKLSTIFNFRQVKQ